MSYRKAARMGTAAASGLHRPLRDSGHRIPQVNAMCTPFIAEGLPFNGEVCPSNTHTVHRVKSTAYRRIASIARSWTVGCATTGWLRI